VSRELALGLALLAGGAFYFALAFYVWQRRRSAGGTALFVYLLGAVVWSKAYAIELAAQSVPVAAVWSGIKFAGVVTVPAALWVFVRQYTRRRPLTRRTLLLLMVEPVLVLLLLAVPATSWLIHSYPPDAGSGSGPIVAESGPLLWVHAAYSWGLLTVALVQFAARVGRVGPPYRRQAAVVLAASLLPLVGNIVYNVGLVSVDPAPFLFVIFSLVLVWGVFRLRLLDLVPVARGRVVEQMPDGVIVLDASGRILDVNPAAADLLGARVPDLVGRYVDEVLPEVANLQADHVGGATSTDELRLPARAATGPDAAPAVDPVDPTDPMSLLMIDVGLGAGSGGDGDGDRTVSARLTSLLDRRGQEIGRLLLLRDITDSTVMEWRLRDLLAEQTGLAETLQAGIRPASLAEVPGVQVAARWVPAGTTGHLSGDFYDVHATLGGDHAFVLGDVAGEGVRSAVVTAMARYTVRTLSAQGWGAQQVLEQLNQALLADQADLLGEGRIDEARSCSVAYGRITRLGPGEVGDGVVVRLALGGHPEPVVRRVDGSLEWVGRRGTALGLVPAVDVREVTVHLRPGEVMLVCCDAVLLARRGAQVFGRERLARLLLDGTPAGETLASRVVDAVRDFAEEPDDIALVVLQVA